MKTIGILGGIGPESTIDYYRKIIAAYRQREPNGNYPQIIINSINLKQMLELITNEQFDDVISLLVTELKKLADAGADFALLASNTPHVVFDKVRELSSLPLISIVEEACHKSIELNLQRVGLFGTKFTMQGKFYPQVFSQHSIQVFTPDETEQKYIHSRYMGELVEGVVRNETRAQLLSIAAKMKRTHNIQGLILGGTELSLILKNSDLTDMLALDTAEIHVESVIKMLEL